MKIGYARISDKSQKDDLQIDMLEKFGCDKIVTEVISGEEKDKKINEVVNEMSAGDVLVVPRTDRLGRNTRQILELAELLKEKLAELVILDLNIDTRTPGGEMVLTIMASVAQYERRILKIKQKQGIDSARKRGVHLGRKANYTKEALFEAIERYENDPGMTYSKIKELYGIPESSLKAARKKRRNTSFLSE